MEEPAASGLPGRKPIAHLAPFQPAGTTNWLGLLPVPFLGWKVVKPKGTPPNGFLERHPKDFTTVLCAWFPHGLGMTVAKWQEAPLGFPLGSGFVGLGVRQMATSSTPTPNRPSDFTPLSYHHRFSQGKVARWYQTSLFPKGIKELRERRISARNSIAKKQTRNAKRHTPQARLMGFRPCSALQVEGKHLKA